MPDHTQTKVDRRTLKTATWPETSPSFATRFIEAAAEYAKFVSGALLAALLCMAAYALIQRIGRDAPVKDTWMFAGSVALNIVLFAAVLLPRVTAWFALNHARDAKQPTNS